MTDDTPTLKDIWRLLGTMNTRFDGLEREMIGVKTQISDMRAQMCTQGQLVELKGQFADLKSHMSSGFGSLKESIEARDFRLDEHGRRITELETLVRG